MVPSAEAASHAAGTPLPYFPFALSIATPGVYTLSANVGGRDLTSSFSVVDPATVKIPKVGRQAAPVRHAHHDRRAGRQPDLHPPAAVPAPRRDAHPGVVSRASRSPTSSGRRRSARPAVCAPILDNLITAHTRLGGKVTMVHAEVYTDNTATTTTPAVQAYDMTFEPCLWITDATGTVVERLDFVFDQGEIDAALAKVAR